MIQEAKPSSFFFFCVFTGLFLAIFYSTVTNIAGIYISSDLGGSKENCIYPLGFFALGNLLSIPLTRPLADRFGPIKLFVQGLLLYTLFSLLCGAASTFFIFNLYRTGLGLASGLFYVLCERLLSSLAPKDKLQSYTFTMILLFSIVPVFGTCVGAWIAYESHWRWIFHINECVALFLAVYFWFYCKKFDPPLSSSLPLFDKVGYLFFALGTGSLSVIAILAQELDWTRSPLILTLMLIGLPSLAFFILWCLRHPTPILEIKLLSSLKLSYSLLSLGILFSAYFGMIILLPLWLNISVHYTPLYISLLLGVMLLSAFFAHFISASLLRHFDPRLTLAIAIIFFIASCAYSTHFNAEVDLFHLSVARFLSGMGLILFLFPLSKLSFESYGKEKGSSIFALFQTTRAWFSCLGAGLYVILWQRRQVFFHERLGEQLTIFSTQTSSYFQRATDQFHLTGFQAKEQLNILLDENATSLALNDVFAFMGILCFALLLLLGLSFKAFKRAPETE